MQTICLFSGLGADERIFENLDLGNAEIHHIRWIQPLEKESMQSYAQRLATQIPAEDTVYIGLSFGGMMALEIARIVPPAAVILISSAGNRHELPFYFRWAGRLGLDKLIPLTLLRHPSRFKDWLFGANTPQSKQLLRTFLKECDPQYLRWAIRCILTWQRVHAKEHVLIHGEKDRLLPANFVKADLLIKKAGHFMVLEEAEEVSAYIRAYLRKKK